MSAQKKNLALSFILICLLSLVKMPLVLAVTCEVNGSSASINNGETSTVNIGINNSGEDVATATEFLNPNTSYIEFTDGSASGWSANVNGDKITFTGGSLQPSSSVTFSIQIKGLAVTNEELQIDGYASSDGSNFDQCYSSSGVSVITPTATPTPTTTTTSSSSGSTSTTTTVTNTVTETKTITKEIKDTQSPSISLTTKFDKSFENAPEIEGKATDDKAVIAAEYSVDDGQNWQPVDNLKSPGERSSTFSFTPIIFDDGNYKIIVRAKDSSANVGTTKTYDLVIDRLPPVVGASLFAVGPQILTPTTAGTIIALPQIQYSFAVSARGGPTEIELTASHNDASQETNSFALSKNPESGLWTTNLSFDKSGIYSLKAKSKDGAGNITERKLTTVIVLEGGKINYLEKPIQNATVSAYYLEPTSQKFILWDSAPYSQTNPQQTDEQGQYKLFLPAGTYYLQVTSPTYRILKTNIFKIDQTLPINTNLKLEKAAYINLGFIKIPLPDFRQSQNEIKINLPELSSQNNNLENKEFPKFTITNSSQTFTDVTLRGKPAIVTLLNTWSPQTPEQIKILEVLTNESEIKVVVIVPQESASFVEIYKKRAGYKIEIIADPDGTLVNPLSLQTSPTHFFLDRKGQIKKQKTGVFTKEELLDYLIN